MAKYSIRLVEENRPLFYSTLYCARITAHTYSAAKLAANPAGEGPASRTCPVATVVIPEGGEGDLSDRKLRSKRPSRQSASGVGSVRGASKSAGCSKRSEPLAAKGRSHW